MPSVRFSKKYSFLSFLFFLLIGSAVVYAHDYTLGTLKIERPWARATPIGAKVGGGFMNITNNGTESDWLIGGEAEISAHFEVHEMRMENHVMQMRALETLEVKPGATLELKPGGYHLMFINIKAPLRAGDRFSGHLIFKKAGKIKVEFEVL